MLDFTDGAETSFAPSPPASARVLLPSVCAHFLQHKHFVYIAHLKVISPPGVQHYSVAKASPLLHTFTGIITIPVKIGGVCGQKSLPQSQISLKDQKNNTAF